MEGEALMDALCEEKHRCVARVNEAVVKAVRYINGNSLSDDAVMHDAERLAAELSALCRKYRQACDTEAVFFPT